MACKSGKFDNYRVIIPEPFKAHCFGTSVFNFYLIYNWLHLVPAIYRLKCQLEHIQSDTTAGPGF